MTDAARPGRPAPTTSKGNIEKIRNILKTGARFTLRQLARMTNLSLARGHAILKKERQIQDGNPFVNGRAKEGACNNGKKLLQMYPKYSKKAFDNIVNSDLGVLF